MAFSQTPFSQTPRGEAARPATASRRRVTPADTRSRVREQVVSAAERRSNAALARDRKTASRPDSPGGAGHREARDGVRPPGADARPAAAAPGAALGRGKKVLSTIERLYSMFLLTPS